MRDPEREREREWIPMMPLSLCHLTSWEGAAYFSTITHQVCVLEESKKPDSVSFLKKQRGLNSLQQVLITGAMAD